MQEVPELVQLQERHAGPEFGVFGIMSGSPEAAAAFQEEHGAAYPILAEAGADFRAWGVQWLPQVYLLDPQGTVVADGLGTARARLEEAL